MSSKSKKILGLITIIVLFLVCIGGSQTSAVSNIPQITVGNTSANRVNANSASGINITIGDTSGTSNKNTNTNKNTNKNTNVNTNKNTNINKNTNKNTSTESSYKNSNRNTNLPYTGTSDSILFVVAALIISAVYAYKKIRDYNV